MLIAFQLRLLVETDRITHCGIRHYFRGAITDLPLPLPILFFLGTAESMGKPALTDLRASLVTAPAI